MTVYTVSVCLGGDDLRLNGVFSTREKAELYAAELSKAKELTCVDEVEVDSLCGHKLRNVFACSVGTDFQIERSWSYQIVAGDDEPDSTDQYFRLFTGRSIKSPERAEELAREALRTWIIEIEEAGR